MDLEKLVNVIPTKVLDQIPEVMDKFDINTPLRLAHFLSQCAHESAEFTATHENLNYSDGGLMRVFGKYFPTKDLALQYARQPQKIANKVYANRMGNGDEESGDGWAYRGRGYIQLTGKNNYGDFGESISVDTVGEPDLVETDYPLASAAWFFDVNNILPVCDGGETLDVCKSVTKRVNGGLNGIDERWQYFQKFYALLDV